MDGGVDADSRHGYDGGAAGDGGGHGNDCNACDDVGSDNGGFLKWDGYEAGSGYEVLAEVPTTTLYLGSLWAPHVNVTGFGQT